MRIVSFILEKTLHVFSKIGHTIKLAIKLHKKKRMMEKGSVSFNGLPILLSPKGYLYTVSDVKKSLFCADCYKTSSRLIPLE
jgi:hypothetical protein